MPIALWPTSDNDDLSREVRSRADQKVKSRHSKIQLKNAVKMCKSFGRRAGVKIARHDSRGFGSCCHK